MSKDMICGKSFEELSNDELMEYEGGAIWTSLSTTTVSCIAASAVISGGVTLVVSLFAKR